MERSLGFIINAANTKMKSKLTRALKPYAITSEQWALLIQLWECDGITQKELADRSCKDQPTTARILDKLAKRGFLERKADPVDRRACLIFLTRKGREIKKPLTALAQQSLNQAWQGFSELDKIQLRNLLYRIMNNLD